MKVRVLLGKTPAAEAKGLPVRVTTFAAAKASSSAEVVVILEGGKIRSIVARPGEFDLYLSPRAKFRMIAPEEPDSETTHCSCCDHRAADPGKPCPDCGAKPLCSDCFGDHLPEGHSIHKEVAESVQSGLGVACEKPAPSALKSGSSGQVPAIGKGGAR